MKAKSPLEQKKDLIITVKISGDREIKALNKKYLHLDNPTDVLSFEIKEITPDGDFHLGDLIVNKEQAQRQCKEYGNDLNQEVAELVKHGVLHLLGVHHDDDDERTVHGVPVRE